MIPSEDKKVDVLLKLMEENKKQIEWVKNLDYNIVYYTVLLFFAIIAWTASKPSFITLPNWFFILAVVTFTILALSFLYRNHYRHSRLNKEYENLKDALSLTKKDVYNSEPICIVGDDWAFIFGRILYAILIILGATFTIILLY